MDLPGVQDANEARNRIAKDYLQNCDAVWIVADIVRAVDNRTAKDLLGDAFRRQLFLDGQYANLTFVCTKADIINSDEFVRSLKLTRETGSYQNIVDEKKKIVAELTTVCENYVVEADVAKEFLAENPDLQTEEVDEMKRKIETAHSNLAAKSLEKLQAEEELVKNEKMIRKICAVARSNKSKQQIASDFLAGIKDMHRKAHGRDDDDDDDDNDDNEMDDEDAFFASKASGFKVFSVSSSDYLKLKGRKRKIKTYPFWSQSVSETGYHLSMDFLCNIALSACVVHFLPD